MTEETRAELRSFITRLIAVAEHDPRAGTVSHYAPSFGQHELVCALRFDPAKVSSELSTAQQLALSVLLGEPDRVVLSALCDLLIEQGHEYGVECYEKGKREEQDRIRNLVLSYANGADPEQSAASVMYGLYEEL